MIAYNNNCYYDSSLSNLAILLYNSFRYVCKDYRKCHVKVSYLYAIIYLFYNIKKYHFQIFKCRPINQYLAYKLGRGYTNSNL